MYPPPAKKSDSGIEDLLFTKLIIPNFFDSFLNSYYFQSI